MRTVSRQYSDTAVVLKIVAVASALLGLYYLSMPYIALGCGYWLASRNPWRYRIVVNVGIICHLLELIRSIHLFFAGSADAPYLALFASPALLAALLVYYPSHYPVSSNILGFLIPTEWLVSFIERFPGVFKKLSGKGIIGKVEGLYINSDAFNIVQEEGFLGFTPSSEIIETAKKAGVEKNKTLLDIGCGIGGPACLLASEFDLKVTGVDLLEWNVEEAKKLAARRGVSGKTRFMQGNALSLPFEDGSFDYVFGMDAWCHVPDRARLLRESHRVLADGGTIFFHDWVMKKADSEGFRFIYAFPMLETIDSYTQKLREAGFDVVHAQPRDERFREHVAGLRRTLAERKNRMIETCGRELYDNWDIVTAYTLRMIEEEKLGGGVFIARKK